MAKKKKAALEWFDDHAARQKLANMGLPIEDYREVEIDDIALDGSLQANTRLDGLTDPDVIAAYRKDQANGDAFPAPVLMKSFRKGSRPCYEVIGGMQRTIAAQENGATHIRALIVGNVAKHLAQLARIALNTILGNPERKEAVIQLTAKLVILHKLPMERTAESVGVAAATLSNHVAAERTRQRAEKKGIKLAGLPIDAINQLKDVEFDSVFERLASAFAHAPKLTVADAKRIVEGVNAKTSETERIAEAERIGREMRRFRSSECKVGSGEARNFLRELNRLANKILASKNLDFLDEQERSDVQTVWARLEGHMTRLLSPKRKSA